MPPPARMVRPKSVNAKPIIPGNVTTGRCTINNNGSFHPPIPLPGNNPRLQSTALIPYNPVVGDSDAPCRRRPRILTPAENFAIMSTASGNVRRRAECAIRREEARAFWMRLRHPTPDDPFGPTAGFSHDDLRLETLGYTYLEISEIPGNSTSRHHLNAEIIRLR